MEIDIFVETKQGYIIMKKILFTLFLSLSTLMIHSQVIRYDTIKVAPNDQRNINRVVRSQKSVNTSKSTAKTSVKKPNTPVSSGFDKTKIRYGANLGLSLSRNYTSINIGPQLGYQASNQFMFGAGVKYNYNKVRGYEYNSSSVYKNNLLGVNTFGYFYPVSFITVFAQPELNYLWSRFENETTGDTHYSNGAVPSVLVGAGLRLGMSHITVNYDLVKHVNSPYSKGVFLGISVFL